MYANEYVYVYLVEYVREYAHMFMTFHNDFMFFATSLTYIFLVIMNRHGHHNIRNGIVWAQTGGTCTATLCVIEI